MLQFQLPNDVYLLISWWILYRSCDGHPSNTVEIICIADRKSSLLWLCTIPFYFNDVTMKAGHILLITEHLPVWNWISTCQHYTFGYSFFSMIFRICLSFLFYSLAFKYTWSSPIFYETFALCHSSGGNFSYFCFRTKLDFSALLFFFCFHSSLNPLNLDIILWNSVCWV